MPLLLTPLAPLPTASGLLASSVYVIIDSYTFVRKLRQVQFQVGYYLNEEASLPESELRPLSVALQRSFALSMTPAQANAAAADPTALLEQHLQANIEAALPGARLETVA